MKAQHARHHADGGRLAAPLGPRKPRTSPRGTVRVSGLTASKVPYDLLATGGRSSVRFIPEVNRQLDPLARTSARHRQPPVQAVADAGRHSLLARDPGSNGDDSLVGRADHARPCLGAGQSHRFNRLGVSSRVQGVYKRLGRTLCRVPAHIYACLGIRGRRRWYGLTSLPTDSKEPP
jgi:hypothetical protein